MIQIIGGPTNTQLSNAASNKILNKTNTQPHRLYYQFCEFNRLNMINEDMIKLCVRMFNEGRENIHKDEFIFISMKICCTTLKRRLMIKSL